MKYLLPGPTAVKLILAFEEHQIPLKQETVVNTSIHFVDKLPFQPWGRSRYYAKVWGKYRIFFNKNFDGQRDLSELIQKHPKRLAHEFVHIKQIEERGSWFKFCVTYIWGLISAKFNYRKNPMEAQAYSVDTDIGASFLNKLDSPLDWHYLSHSLQPE